MTHLALLRMQPGMCLRPTARPGSALSLVCWMPPSCDTPALPRVAMLGCRSGRDTLAASRLTTVKEAVNPHRKIFSASGPMGCTTSFCHDERYHHRGLRDVVYGGAGAVVTTIAERRQMVRMQSFEYTTIILTQRGDVQCPYLK